jgi:hypothetical protein
MRWYVSGGLLLLFLVGPTVSRAAFETCTVTGTAFDTVCGIGHAFGANDPAGAVAAAVLGWIGDMLAALVASAETWVLSLLPDAGDLGIPDLSGLVVGFAWLNGFLALDAGVSVAGILIGATLATFAFRLALTIWHVIPKPFSGT